VAASSSRTPAPEVEVEAEVEESDLQPWLTTPEAPDPQSHQLCTAATAAAIASLVIVKGALPDVPS